MKRQTKILAALFSVVVGLIAASNSHALPYMAMDSVDFYGHPFLTSQKVATVNIKVFDKGVNTGDLRFDNVTPGTNVTPGSDDKTFLYEVAIESGVVVTRIKMDTPALTTISSAGFVSQPVGVGTTILPNSVIFDFSQVDSGGPRTVDIYITSPSPMGDVGSFLTSNFSIGPGEFMLGPSGPAPVPEPGTVLLLGFGLIGLAGLGRKKFLGHVKKD